jgi:hypothetical protein
MSFRAVLWALEQDLDRIPKLILVSLASHANKETGRCFPKIKTIAQKASVSIRTVHRYLPKLESARFIEIERVFDGGARRPHVYWIKCPCSERKPVAADISRRDKGGRANDHNLNHYRYGEPISAKRERSASHTRSKVSGEHERDQAAQVELARRLGPDGWEILIAFPDEISALAQRLLLGLPIDTQLVNLRSRFALRSKSEGC